MHSVVFLLAFTCVYGIEIGYKFSTRQFIFLLNPCHLLTLTNIVVLASFVAGRSDQYWSQMLQLTGAWFVHGPITAIVFPVTNTLLLPLEVRCPII